ncbi:WXG100 family type VII secretion target, partial [Nocardioides hankookensis]
MGFGDDLVDDAVTELRSILADLQGIDLWPPWDAAETIVRLVSRACEIASQPPEPDPANLRDAADEWRLIATTMDRAHTSLETLHDDTTTAIWEGDAGNGFRSSVTAFAGRVDTIPEAARGVAAALDTMAGAMDAARK